MFYVQPEFITKQFLLLWTDKVKLNGHMFMLGSIVRVALVQQFRQQPNNSFGEGIHILLH
jgi:hypothetical protein